MDGGRGVKLQGAPERAEQAQAAPPDWEVAAQDPEADGGAEAAPAGKPQQGRRKGEAKKRDATSTALTLQPSTELAAIERFSPLRDLRGYLSAIHRIKLLTPEEEEALARAYRERGDLDAARRLVLANLRFVTHIARGYEGYGLPKADLLQEGNIGLMKAVQRFNPDVGVRLISFAVHWIKSEIHEYILRNWKIMRMTTTKAQKKLFFNLRRRKQGVNQLTPEEAESIAEELNVRAEDVLEMDHRLSGGIEVAFEGPEEEGAASGAIHYLADGSYAPAPAVEDQEWDDYRSRRLRESLKLLDERSRDIISKRWMSDKRTTLEELSEQYGISGERVRQIEVAAMKKIRAAMEA